TLTLALKLSVSCSSRSIKSQDFCQLKPKNLVLFGDYWIFITIFLGKIFGSILKSRCSSPPPGYTLSRASEEALIESIKLQKEREKSKEERKKDKKREKKDKKEKKEKKKEKKDKTHQNLDKSGIVQGHIGKKIWPDAKVELLYRGSQAEPEQLERSSLTEEHGQPVCLCAPSTSSDSTENSNKRKRQSSPADVARGHSKIVFPRLPLIYRIRLPVKKPNESGDTDRICSTSGSTPFPSQNKDDISLKYNRGNVCCTLQETSNIAQGLSRRTDREQICSTSGQINPVTAVKTGIPSASNTVMTPMQRMELQYKNLIENWIPPKWLDSSLNSDDEQDWLFLGKNEGQRAEKRQKAGNDSLPCSSSSAIWPHAQYLQDVDVYALPFTVPF
ncbi:uncharacterized protein LOC110012291, partial [Sesamum indicum]|uniref:Uncharacterized protein LOC110012291 n=1 Tax=Sesamum indicum TaxID=4182 RepID=A0A8M8V4B5_SESIN